MMLLAWRAGRIWTRWHVLRFGAPLCGTRVPDPVQRLTAKPQQLGDWRHICERCRAIVIRPKKDPASSGQAASGANGSAGAAGPAGLESRMLAENGQSA